MLPESDLADMDDFVARLQILLPVLGADFLRPTPAVRQLKNVDQAKTNGAKIDGEANGNKNTKSTGSPEFRMNAGGLQARAVELDGQMIVLAGSDARADEAPSLASNVRVCREQLLKTGKLRPVEGSTNLRFIEDVAFTSPSAAAPCYDCPDDEPHDPDLALHCSRSRRRLRSLGAVARARSMTLLERSSAGPRPTAAARRRFTVRAVALWGRH